MGEGFEEEGDGLLEKGELERPEMGASFMKRTELGSSIHEKTCIRGGTLRC